MLAGGLVASAAGLLVMATSGTDSSPWLFEIGLGLTGAGIGLTMPPATGAIMSSLPPHKAGVGSAVNNLVRELGGAFGIGVLGSVTLVRYQSQLTGAIARRHAHGNEPRPTFDHHGESACAIAEPRVTPTARPTP